MTEQTVITEQYPNADMAAQQAHIETLVTQAREGDTEAFGEIFKLTHAQLFGMLLRKTGDSELAADLTQGTFEKALKHFESYEHGSFVGWLNVIGKNLFIDTVRSTTRKPTQPLYEHTSTTLRAPDNVESTVLANIDTNVEEVLALIDNEDYRNAVRLVVIEGLTYEEAASRLDIKLGTLRSRTHRGVHALKQLLSHRDQVLHPEFRAISFS